MPPTDANASNDGSTASSNQSSQTLQQWLDQTFAWIGSDPDASDATAAEFAAPQQMNWPVELLDSLPDFIDRHFEQMRPLQPFTQRLDSVVSNLAVWLQQYIKSLNANTSGEATGAIVRVAIGLARLYRVVQPHRQFSCEGVLLRTLLAIPSEQSVPLFVSQLVNSPPSHYRSAAGGIETLIRRKGWAVEDVFPEILDGLDHPSTIAAVLDLANWCYHSQQTDEHPAEELDEKLESLLEAVVQRLETLEQDPTQFGDDVRVIQRILDESVALCVSLCDAVGLLDCRDAVPTLNRAVGLRHRRIVCEAAAALARMEQPLGKKLLIELAGEPIARLRVLAYAKELGFSDEISAKSNSERAIGESTLALWLAAPENYGIAPRTIELIDERMLSWPSFSDPQQCFLFRFVYPLAEGQLSNVAIAGPMVHAFAADMAELPILDIYAAFAGNQTEHEEIFELSPSEFTNSLLQTANGLKTNLQRSGYSEIEIWKLASFFGDWVIIAQATLNSLQGVVVYDGIETLWYASTGRNRPIGLEEAYCIFKGRRILRTFNPDL